MKLLLTSAGNTNASITNALLDLLGKPFTESHIVYIPTAANVEEGDKAWLVDDMYSFRKLGFASYEIVDIAAVSKEIWYPRFEKADVLVFGGGNEKYLLEWLHKSGVAEYLPSVLAKKVYVGISAGSMVTSKNIALSSVGILYYEKYHEPESVPGLGFIDFEIRPHLNSPWFPKVKLNYMEKLAQEIPSTFYAIDDNTAVKVVDGQVEVISEGEWKKFN